MTEFTRDWKEKPDLSTPITDAWLTAVDKVARSVRPAFRIDVVEDCGAVVNGSTDDTAAWQAALDAVAAAGGGVIYSSKAGVSVIAGALVDTSGANCQLKLPSVDYVDTENITVVIEGPMAPPNVFSVIGTTPLPDGHLVLKSTLTSGSGGAMIGARGPVGTFGNFTNVTLRIENVGFRMPVNPTHTALDLRYVACADLDNVVVDAGNYYCEGISQPSTTTSFAIRLPGNNNGAHTRLGQVDVIGFYNGYEFAEHTSGQYVAAWACRRAFTFLATNHASKFQRLAAYHCQRGIIGSGTHYVDVDQYDIEHAPSGTWVTTYDVDDASSYLHGTAWWHVVLGGTGIDGTFTKNGGTAFNTSRVGSVASGGGGGTAFYVARDRLVATAGQNTLTLGAVPIANSPLIWVNGTIKWPSTDYVISSSVVTFTTPLSASDVVLVYYDTTNALPGTSNLSTTGGVADTFTRADSSSSLGVTSTGAVAWSALRGTWGISTNRAYVSSGHSSTLQFAVVESGLADGTIQFTVASNTFPNQSGSYFRATDANNGYILESGVASTAKLYKYVAGVATQIAASAGTVTFNTGDVIQVVLAGTSITVKRNGTTIITVTDSTYTTQTKHGLYTIVPSGGTTPLRLDDFSVAP